MSVLELKKQKPVHQKERNKQGNYTSDKSFKTYLYSIAINENESIDLEEDNNSVSSKRRGCANERKEQRYYANVNSFQTNFV